MKKILFILIGILMLCSCHTTKTIQTEYIHDTLTVNRTDSVIKNHFDSIYVHDSIYTTKYLRGDTVFLETVKYKLIYKQRDTGQLNSSKRDSVHVKTVYKDRIIVKTQVKTKKPWYVKPLIFIVILYTLFIFFKIIKNRLTTL